MKIFFSFRYTKKNGIYNSQIINPRIIQFSYYFKKNYVVISNSRKNMFIIIFFIFKFYECDIREMWYSFEKYESFHYLSRIVNVINSLENGIFNF